MNLKLKDIAKSYGKNRVLSNVNLALYTGEIIGLLGRNGTGKSSLLKIIFGKEKPTKGQILLNQQKFIPYNSFQKQMVAYLPQQNMLPKNVRVRDIIPMIFSDGDLQDRIFYSPGVADFANNYVQELSHGQQKYLGVLLASNLPHPILLLDEPFSMADPLTISLIKKQLLAVKPNKIILITDHYYQDVMELSNQVHLLKDGTLLLVNSTDMLKALEYTR